MNRKYVKGPVRRIRKRGKIEILLRRALGISILVAMFLVLVFVVDTIHGSAREDDTATQIEKISSDVAALYSDESKEMLSEEATTEEVNSIEDEITEATKFSSLTLETRRTLNETKRDLDDAQLMIDLRDSALALLTDGKVNSDSDIKKVESKATELERSKPEFVESMMPLIDKSYEQQDELETATELVNSLFEDVSSLTVREDVTREEYDEACSATYVVADEEVKEGLDAMLVIVDDYLTANGEPAYASDDPVSSVVGKPDPSGGDVVASLSFMDEGVVLDGITACETTEVQVIAADGEVMLSEEVDPDGNGEYSVELKLSELPFGEYEIVTKCDNDTYSLTNNLEPIHQIVRAKVGDKLITFSYPDDRVYFTVEPHYYVYDVNINVGHGDWDDGSISCDGELYEESLNLAVSMYEKERYEELGMTVHVNRTSDDTYGEVYGPSTKMVELQRSAMSHGYYGTISKVSYSNHHNSNEDSTIAGFEILVSPGATFEELASEFEIAEYLNQIYPYDNNELPIYSVDYDTNAPMDKSQGQVYDFKDNFVMNRIPDELFNVKSVIYEGCYTSNPSEFEWYWYEENYKVVSEYKIKVYAEYCGYEYIPPTEEPPAGAEWPDESE